ncbi:MAG TPA: hypothetical protein VLE91_02210 [Candidatus Saccharimonadales bacterium]|nr:hypothetical protein [Candidatus Saccharimonadales bacterium]
MKLTNLTRKTILATDLKEAVSPTDKFLGLLKKSNPRSLFFTTRFGIHTLLLGTLIDVIVMDNKNRVVKQQTVKPNQLFIYNPKYSKVIELPRGVIKKSKTQIGDKLSVKTQ